jgi:hypothetical protein
MRMIVANKKRIASLLIDYLGLRIMDREDRCSIAGQYARAMEQALHLQFVFSRGLSR